LRPPPTSTLFPYTTLFRSFSLVAEGLGFHVPKGYLYAAIGFSIMIEACNQLARRNRSRRSHGLTARERTAQAVLRLLRGGKTGRSEEHTSELQSRENLVCR